jgi:mono/diheme cytochrome c family protein
VKSCVFSFLLTVSWLAAFGACAVAPKREAAPKPASVASVEIFLPDSVRAVFKRSCESCHGYDGHGIAGIAPDMLRSFGHKAEEWEAYFVNPQSVHPGAQMPSTVWMNQDEIKAVATFLANLPNPSDRASAPASP